MEPRIDPQVVLPALAVLASAYLIVPAALISRSEAKRPVVVRCPADDELAVVTRSPLHAALHVFGSPERVATCNRKYLFETCGRTCAAQL